ncbi:MAG: EI24 domain-containing protein [Aromatoleum sp.]|nr:EI24 domain-containing protein [Aromatoleum sp.]
MNSVGRALARAAPLLLDPRVLGLVMLPLAAAAGLVTTLALVFWTPLLAAITKAVADALTGAGLMSALLTWLVTTGGSVAAFLLLLLVAGALALAAIAVLAGPVFTRVVEARYFPGLERKRGGTLWGGAMNAVATFAVWVPLWLLTLPFLLVPMVGIPLSLLLAAWLSQRLFRYDALADHASEDERATVLRRARGRLYALGLTLAPLSFVPFVNLLAPLYAGLAFTCLCLDDLGALRARTPRAG